MEQRRHEKVGGPPISAHPGWQERLLVTVRGGIIFGLGLDVPSAEATVVCTNLTTTRPGHPGFVQNRLTYKPVSSVA
jgi:hypothetical protein